MKLSMLLATIALCYTSYGQTIEEEYNEKRDFSVYKSFTLGNSQISTSENQKQIPDSIMHKWLTGAIAEQLLNAGLQRRDTSADLVITYLQWSNSRMDEQKYGIQILPSLVDRGGGKIPDHKFDYRQSCLTIDLNDRSGNLIWRIKATTNLTAGETKETIYAIVRKSLRKFGKLHRKKGR